MTPMELNKLRVLIVGCGNIAGGFDIGSDEGGLPLTHAGAYAAHPRFQITACIEPDAGRRQAFTAQWQVPTGHASFEELESHPNTFDVISICSPTAEHGRDLHQSLALRPRAIFCEKPVTPSAAATAHWVDACASANVLLAINHTRRWAPDIVRLQDELRSGVWGTIRSVVGHYNKGLLNNGGHMVDLLLYLLGPLSVAWAGPAVSDFWQDDPSVAAVLISKQGTPIHLSTANARDYALFELEIVTSVGVITMENGGLNWRWRRVLDDPDFKGYKRLGVEQTSAGEYRHAMLNAVTNLHDAIRHGAALASTGQTALQAQILCEQIRDFVTTKTIKA